MAATKSHIRSVARHKTKHTLSDNGAATGSAATVGLLEDYRRLRDFFPTVSMRASALGVTRDTVMSWDAARIAKTRVEHRDRLKRFRLVAEFARELLPDDVTTGRWMRSPQTFLYGENPSQFLLLGGESDVILSSLRTRPTRVSPKVRAAFEADADLD